MKLAAVITAVVVLTAQGLVWGDDVPRVLVVPFNALHVPEAQQGIGKGAQKSVVADFSRSGVYQAMASQTQVIVEDNATAARLGRAAESQYVVRGAAHVVEGNIRLTAQLIDARSGGTIRSGCVTGPAGSIRVMEDELGAQLRGQSTDAARATTGGAGRVAGSDAPVEPVLVVATPPVRSSSSTNGQYPDGNGGGGLHRATSNTTQSHETSLPIAGGYHGMTPTNYDMIPTNSWSMVPTNSWSMVPTNSWGMVPTNSWGMGPTNFGHMSPTNSGGMSPTNSGGMSPTNFAGMSPAGGGMAPTNGGSMVPSGSKMVPTGGGSMIPTSGGGMAPAKQKKVPGGGKMVSGGGNG
jgi:TolB-like protein